MILLNVQFWEGDKAQAMALAKLICDLEDQKRDDVYMMFTARFDCEFDEAAIEYASHVFRTVKYRTRRNATGWPHGPNQMMADSYENIVERWRRKELKDVDCVMMIEADCVPLKKGWIDDLYWEFKGCGKKVLGAWLKKGDANVEHINGNCLMSIDFWKKCPGIFHPPSRGGWDASLSYAILPNGAPSKLIWSDYQLGMDHNPWRGDDFLWEPKRYTAKDNPFYGIDLQPCWFHGIKTDKGIQAVRKRLLDESENQAN